MRHVADGFLEAMGIFRDCDQLRFQRQTLEPSRQRTDRLEAGLYLLEDTLHIGAQLGRVDSSEGRVQRSDITSPTVGSGFGTTFCRQPRLIKYGRRGQDRSPRCVELLTPPVHPTGKLQHLSGTASDLVKR